VVSLCEKKRRGKAHNRASRGGERKRAGNTKEVKRSLTNPTTEKKRGKRERGCKLDSLLEKRKRKRSRGKKRIVVCFPKGESRILDDLNRKKKEGRQEERKKTFLNKGEKGGKNLILILL